MPKVLVVDESASVRTVVERSLQSQDIEVLCAASGRGAIAQIGREEPDLVVCDVTMSDMEGYELCEFVRDHPRLGRTPVLLMSGIVNGAVLARAAEVRASDVIRKPFAAGELLSKVDGLLGLAAVARPAPSISVGRPAGASSPELEGEREDVKAVLGRLAALSGVSLAVLVDREGFLIESAGDMLLESDLAGALAVGLAQAAQGIGRELNQGDLTSLIAEYDGGLILVNTAGPAAMLATVLCEPALLGKVRYHVKTTLSDLREVL